MNLTDKSNSQKFSLRKEPDGSLTLCCFGPDMFHLWRVSADKVPVWCADFKGTFSLSGQDAGFLKNAQHLGTLHTLGFRPERALEALIELTPRCNRNCPHCYVKHNSGIKELSAEEWKTAFSRLAQSGVMVVHLTGGEPFVRSDIVEIVRAARDVNLRVHLDTNATMVTQAQLEKLAALGLDSLNVGFDGPCEKIYALTRKSTDFEVAVKVVKSAVALGVNVVFFFCMHKGNRRYLNALRRLASSLGVCRISIDPVQPVISNTSATAPGAVCYPLIVATKLWGLLLSRVFSSPRIGWDVRCNMGLTSFGIHADGKISPCVVSTCCFGNVLTDDVAKLWQGEKFTKYANAVHYAEPCNTCFVPKIPWMKKRFLGKCLFDCRAEVYCRTGNALGGNDRCFVQRVLKKIKPGKRL